MAATGWKVVLIGTCLTSCGSINGVMSGKIMGDLFIATEFFLNVLKGYYLSSSYCPEMRT